MATAVETTTAQPQTPTQPAKLTVASLVGAVYVLACLAVVFYAIPVLWRENVAKHLGDGIAELFFRILIQAVAVPVLAWFGQTLAGQNPPKGIRGGIFLMISAAIAIFFIVRAVGMNINADQIAMIGMAIVGGVLIFLAFRLFASPRGEKWMVGLEEQGWFHFSPYKRALGQRARRLTMLGILLIGGSGVYAMMYQQSLPQDWVLRMPLRETPITVMTDLRYSGPFFLMVLTVWIAYRAVNLPPFAEFLIATEAEMNKVSWSTRRGLTQDTIVVLFTTVFMTVFLLVVDVFWGWALSQVGVLPGKKAQQEIAKDGGRW